jgi:hypothetical protein
MVEQPVLELNHRTIIHSVRRERLTFARVRVEQAILKQTLWAD